jgi:hypothetical protein
MDTKRIIINGLGIALGGGLMYLAVRKTSVIRNRTLPSTLVEGGAIVGGASVGYFLSNLVANRVLGAGEDMLPEMQATALPSGETPVETPSVGAIKSNMAASAKAVNSVTPVANQADILSGNVIDITKNTAKVD